MSTMQLELPALTWATALEQAYLANSTQTCTDFYSSSVICGFTSEVATNLCANATFDFSDTFKSSFALVNLFLFKDQFNPVYYNQFMSVTGFSSTDMDNKVYASTSKFSKMIGWNA